MCLICQRIELIKKGENPYFVKELETGYLVIGDHQYFAGYSLFLAKEHVTELHHLEKETRLRFLEEMSLVQEAVAKAFTAEKMNIELLGNGDAHLHWHLFPRRTGDMNGHGLKGRGPVWWVPFEEMTAETCQAKPDEIKRLVKRLSSEVDKLLRQNRQPKLMGQSAVSLKGLPRKKQKWSIKVITTASKENTTKSS